MADPAIQIWVWVASFLGSLAQEGEPPGHLKSQLGEDLALDLTHSHEILM